MTTKIAKLYADDNKQQHISMVSKQTIAAVRVQVKSGTK